MSDGAVPRRSVSRRLRCVNINQVDNSKRLFFKRSLVSAANCAGDIRRNPFIFFIPINLDNTFRTVSQSVSQPVGEQTGI